MMLKKRDVHEVPALFELAIHPDVAPFNRYHADTVDEFYFMTKQMIDGEKEGKLLSRTILDEYEQPIGTINLFDIHDNTGFLATWIGAPYFGKGYNKQAKEEFLLEVFSTTLIEYIFMKVKKTNIRSKMAALKLPYIIEAHTLVPHLDQTLNIPDDIYDVFIITKEHFISYRHFISAENPETEIVS